MRAKKGRHRAPAKERPYDAKGGSCRCNGGRWNPLVVCAQLFQHTAAARAGLKRVLLPGRNRKDLEDVSEDVRQRLEFIFLDQVDDLIANGLEAEPARQPESAQAA